MVKTALVVIIYRGEFPSVVGFLLDASGISVNAIEGSTQSPVYVR